jgi:hypothetical protein
LSVFTRSPGERGMREGAITWQRMPMLVSRRCSSGCSWWNLRSTYRSDGGDLHEPERLSAGPPHGYADLLSSTPDGWGVDVLSGKDNLAVAYTRRGLVTQIHHL